MTYRPAARPQARRPLSTVALTSVALVAALAILAGSRLFGPGDARPTPDAGSSLTSIDADLPVPEPARSLGESGHVRGGVTVFDEDEPAVGNLDPALLDALRRAAAEASGDDIELYVNSGWRSAEYQAQLLRDAVAEYGSEKEAARWVSPPEKSAHVSGDAVDIGPTDAMSWLSQHGAAYGLCQIYGNEPWHYELRPDAVDDGCPEQYADPTHDPRMTE